MTAGPHQYRYDLAAAWWVHTDQGVVLAGPFPDEAAARAAGNEVAGRLRASMRQERYAERVIGQRVAALRVGRGTRQWPYGWFDPADGAPVRFPGTARGG